MPAPEGPFWVVCEDYAKGPIKTREQAQRVLTLIEESALCTRHHQIEEFCVASH